MIQYNIQFKPNCLFDELVQRCFSKITEEPFLQFFRIFQSSAIGRDFEVNAKVTTIHLWYSNLFKSNEYHLGVGFFHYAVQ